MEIVIDSTFKEAYSLYFSDLHESTILDEVNSVFTKYDPDLITDTINIVKTAMSLGLVYTECYDKVVEKIIKKFPLSDDIDRFVLCIVVKILIARNSVSLNSLLTTPRNIFKEVASKYYRIPITKVSDTMIKKITMFETELSDEECIKTTNGRDEYYYGFCVQAARNSKCLLKKKGVVVVNEKSILCVGYNGPPSGIPSCEMRWRTDADFFDQFNTVLIDDACMNKCPIELVASSSLISKDTVHLCPGGSAESNAIADAAKNGVSLKNSTMYIAGGIPSAQCLNEIINAGIKEIVVTSLKIQGATAMYLLNQSNIGIRLFDFIKI